MTEHILNKDEKGYYGFSIQNKYFKSIGIAPTLEKMFKAIFNSMYEEGTLAFNIKDVKAEIKTHNTVDGDIVYVDADFYFDN